MPLPAIKSGFDTGETARTAHNTAVALGALRAFCAAVYKHMCIINAIVETDSVNDLFTMSAKYEMMRDGSIAHRLQHVVSAVFESPDGMPRFGDAYSDTVRDVMKDYSGAMQAALQGRDALRIYQNSVMMPFITDVSTMENQIIEDADAEAYMQNVDTCCALYDSNRHEGPLFDLLASAIQ